MEITRGYREPINKRFDENQEIQLEVSVSGPAVYDVSCFGVDGENKLSDDRYMIFYNQLESPNRELRMVQDPAKSKFFINLSRLPAAIQNLVFTVSIDGEGIMSQLTNLTFIFSQPGREPLSLTLSGASFAQEKAVVGVEIYRKPDWRMRAVAAGFNGGLAALLEAYGGEAAAEAESPAPTPPVNVVPPVNKVSLEKKLERAPALVSLVKPLKVTLEKTGLSDVVARVALVLDISGSMSGRYKNGTVQMIVDKVLPIAVQFDDDGELDFWYYGTRAQRMPSVTLDNYTTAVPIKYKKLMNSLGGGNNEPVVMREIITEYQYSTLPAYVIFITDGGIGKTNEIKQLMRESSNYPIFWQFVGVGGYSYGVLEELDSMDGRRVDNANFFALDDFKKVPNEELYSRLLNEFPKWLREAKSCGIIR